MQIPKGRKPKPAYEPVKRTVCEGCPKKDSAACEDCPAKIGYDAADALQKRQYYKEYKAIYDNRREKVCRAIQRHRKEKTRRKRW